MIQEGAEEIRPVEELQTVTDCVEEIMYAMKKAYAVASLIISTPEAERVGYDLYDRVEAVILRAQQIPRPTSIDSQHRSW